MGLVIGFAAFLTRHRRDAPEPPAGGPEGGWFTRRDRADLARWTRPGRSVSLCASDLGTFAMLYRDGQSWASWGVVRQNGTILLWDCVTLADIARFATVAEALATLPADAAPLIAPLTGPTPNVVRFVSHKAAATAISCSA